MNYTDRDLSWLSFNERILLEAENTTVPLMERLKFMAIFSSNLEEFYKVRVASHHFAQKYQGDKKNKFGFRPSFILQQINHKVSAHQERLGKLFYEEIIPGLEKESIYLLANEFSQEDDAQIAAHFNTDLREGLEVQEITNASELQLKNQTVYLYAICGEKLFLIEMDYKKHGRFIEISTSDKEQRIVQLDDVYKKNLSTILPGLEQVYAIKISRDAELYIDEEQDEDIVKKIKKSIRKRDTGLPSRLLFDENIPFRLINELRKRINVGMSGLIPGGRYHNFYDFFGFPVSESRSHLFYPPKEKVPCSRLNMASNWFEEIKRKDLFLSFPYQDYSYVTRFLKMASLDDAVEEINITLYRVADTSEICQALEIAAKSGKKVFVLDEVQARFDEESNIYWGERLSKAGAEVKYGLKNMKVHAKIFTVKRREEGKLVTYSYMGTGNFNEKTAGIYGDHAVLSINDLIAKDLDELFAFLQNEKHKPTFKTLLVAPFTLRSSLETFIANEIQVAKQNGSGEMTIKLNSLEDTKMINAIREAADAGVKVNLIVRGICCYKSESAAQKKNVRIVSVVDQYLEHTRVYHFENGPRESLYLASADWMTRNLSKRVEVAFPLLDQTTQTLIKKELEVQFNDNVKGRVIGHEKENVKVKGNNKLSSQEQMFELVQKFDAYDI